MNIFNLFAPKKKKKSAAKIVLGVLGVAAAVALCPLVINSDKKKGERGYGSLLLSIVDRPRKEGEGREITFTVPGVYYVADTLRDLKAKLAAKRPSVLSMTEEDFDFDLGDDEFFDDFEVYRDSSDEPTAIMEE